MSMNLPDGYGFIGGRSSENAKRALDAAEKVGLGPEVVMTNTDGYIVPNEVLDAYNGEDEKKAPAKKPASRARKTATKEEQ
jgi:hypothetical protein